jgi:hypothetical protein
MKLSRKGYVTVATACVVAAAWVGFAISRHEALRDQVRAGFGAAQGCEPEIDDDLSNYVQCIDARAADGKQAVPWRLGLHFQSWLMADLAARQDAFGADEARARWRGSWTHHADALGLGLAALCHLKGLDTQDVQRRLDAAAQPRSINSTL